MLGLLVGLLGTLLADEVHLITNFPFAVDPINAQLGQRGSSQTLIIKQLSDYGPAIRKKRAPLFSKPSSHSKIIFYNLTPSYLKKFSLSKFPKEQLVLFMWEPPTVIHQMYDKKTLSLFSKIYTWDDSLVDNQTFFKFYYPVLRPMIADPLPFKKKKLCTLIASDLSSTHPSELYSARKEAIRFFEERNSSDFVFYGRLWKSSEHPLYKGEVADKTEILKHYRFSLCYENSTNILGYVSEKIFDCFAAANVPVYWGATNIEHYIPKTCFIDRRDFPSLDTLYTFLKTMTEERYNQYLHAIQTFLTSAQADKFSLKNFETLLLEEIDPSLFPNGSESAP